MGKEITKYTIIRCIYTVLANPTHLPWLLRRLSCSSAPEQAFTFAGPHIKAPICAPQSTASTSTPHSGEPHIIPALHLPCRLVNFESDFSDGLALYSLLVGYWPAYASKKMALHTSTDLSGPDRHDNAELIVRLLAVRLLQFVLVNE